MQPLRIIGTLVLLGLAGACREAVESPTAPETEPSPVTTPTATLAFLQMNGSCGVATDNVAYCWGANNAGQVGDGTTETRLRPVRVSGGLLFRQISAADNHVCAVTTDDRAYCWGWNYTGQLGDGSTIDSRVPVAVTGGLRFRRVAVGGETSCGVTTRNLVYCWGGNYYGALGNGTTDPSSVPVAVAGGRRFHGLTVSGLSACAINSNDVPFCWGDNSAGQLGDGTTGTQRLFPVRVRVGELRFRQVSAGGSYTCGVTTTDVAYCWGSNENARLGNGTWRQSTTTPSSKVRGGVRFRTVTAGGPYTCGVATSGAGYCWGLTPIHPISTPYRLPVPVDGGLVFRQMEASYGHTCGVTADSAGYCWGRNSEGALGDGTTTHRATPVPVASPAE